MTARLTRRGWQALAAAAATAIITITVVASAVAARSPGGAFPPLHPAAAPAGWPHLTLSGGTAVLSYPPSLRPLAGDKAAVTAAQLSAGGRYQLYLNATPRQGTETLHGWAAFRLHHLLSDHAAAAHEVAAAQDVKFRGGTGSCVIDNYRTRIGAHHFQEIACLVQGHTSASVIIAAAPTATWAQARPLLFQAVDAYLVR
jgi:hypothetical protein